MPFQWTVAPGQTLPQMVEAYTRTILVSGRRIAHSRAAEAELWMKANAPWTDRTGAARAGLYTEVTEAPGIVAEILFSHDPALDYTLWLEVARGGQYAIIAPAIDHWGPILMQDLQRLINLGLVTRGPTGP